MHLLKSAHTTSLTAGRKETFRPAQQLADRLGARALIKKIAEEYRSERSE